MFLTDRRRVQSSIYNERSLLAQRGMHFAWITLAWLLQQAGMIAIPKAGRLNDVGVNHRALEIKLSPEELKAINT